MSEFLITFSSLLNLGTHLIYVESTNYTHIKWVIIALLHHKYSDYTHNSKCTQCTYLDVELDLGLGLQTAITNITVNTIYRQRKNIYNCTNLDMELDLGLGLQTVITVNTDNL